MMGELFWKWKFGKNFDLNFFSKIHVFLVITLIDCVSWSVHWPQGVYMRLITKSWWLSNLDFGWKTPLGSWFFEFFDSKKMPSLWAFYWCWKKFHPTIWSVWTHWTGGLQVIISTHTHPCLTFVSKGVIYRLHYYKVMNFENRVWV